MCVCICVCRERERAREREREREGERVKLLRPLFYPILPNQGLKSPNTLLYSLIPGAVSES